MIDIDEYKESLEALKSGFLDIADIEPYMETICKALEKQIPEKVTTNGYVYFCPECRGSVWQIKPESRYCFRCGQALDWSDTDE